MKVYVITGYSKSIGSFEPEIFASKEKALVALEQYREEYEGVAEDETYITFEEGYGWATVTETKVIEQKGEIK